MNKFDPQDLSVENYSKILGKEFLAQKIIFMRRTAYPKRSASVMKSVSLPIFGSASKHFKSEIKRKYTHGLLFYQDGYDFMKTPEKWKIIKIDTAITPSAIVYAYKDIYFTERSYNKNNFLEVKAMHKSPGDFKKICNLSKMKNKRSYFEKVIGLFIDFNDWEYPFYHTYTPEITLDSLTQHTALPIKRYMQKHLVQAFKELNDKEVYYTECQPTNIGYVLSKDKFVFNPHNCIHFKSYEAEISDIGTLLYTHDWIRTNITLDDILKYYLGSTASTALINKTKNKVSQDFISLNKGEVPSVTEWQQRNLKLFNFQSQNSRF